MIKAKIAILGLLAAFLTGCLSMPYYERTEATLAVNDDHIARVGDVFFEVAHRSGADNGTGALLNSYIDGIENKSFKYVLTVSSASRERLVLDYSEYTLASLNQYGAISKNLDNWVRRSAYDRRLDFDLTESNRVFYGEAEFEVIESLGGYVKYRRIK